MPNHPYSKDKVLNTFDRMRLIEEAKEILENDQSLWPTKYFSGYEETSHDALRNLLMVIGGDLVALERIKKSHGAI